MMDSAEVIRRLAGGLSLAGMGLAKVDGRWDLRVLQPPKPKISDPENFGGHSLAEIHEPVELKKLTLDSLDLRGVEWCHLRLFDVTVRFSHRGLLCEVS